MAKQLARQCGGTCQQRKRKRDKNGSPEVIFVIIPFSLEEIMPREIKKTLFHQLCPRIHASNSTIAKAKDFNRQTKISIAKAKLAD